MTYWKEGVLTLTECKLWSHICMFERKGRIGVGQSGRLSGTDELGKQPNLVVFS